MLKTYTWPKYAYRQSDEQRSGRPARHPVVVVGAGPIGLTAALDCARRGLDVLIVDDNDTVSVGSRAVCYAKRPLEVWDRIGRRGDGTPTLGERMAERGVSWKLGRVYFRDEPVYTFDLLPEAHHKMPAMVNLQQYHLEEMLVAACEANPRIDLRWKHRVLSLAQRDDHIVLQVETPDGIFCTEAQWVVACDGANSELRRMVGAGFSGQFFQDRFLIADIVMKRDMPAERRFWFDPPFHRGQSVLLHKQPDDVWRVDFQLGWDTDPEVEKQPERVRERVRAALGEDVEFELEWVSVYTRSTDFITPKSRASRLYRDAVLGLAKTEPFARPLVNSGRLSTPTPYPRSPLNTPDEAHFAGAMRPGTVCADAPVLVDGRRGWLLEQLGDGFTLLAFGRRPAVDAVRVGDVVARVLHVGSDLIELGGVLSERYDGRPGTTYLIRPDQHVAARWRGFDSADIEPAIARAIGRAE